MQANVYCIHLFYILIIVVLPHYEPINLNKLICRINKCYKQL